MKKKFRVGEKVNLAKGLTIERTKWGYKITLRQV